MRFLNKISKALAACLLLSGLSFADNQATSVVNFGGGVNVKTSAIDIGDNETPDSSNMINDAYGTAFKRDGSSRYLSQAISSNPVNSLYRAYVTSGTAVRKFVVATTRDSVFQSSSTDNQNWVLISSGLTGINQRFSSVMFNGKLLTTGNQLTDNVIQYDFNLASATPLFINTSSDAINVLPKYFLLEKNYLIGANCKVQEWNTTLQANATYYPSRLYYSTLLVPSSVTVSRFIDIKPNDGDQIMGIGVMNRAVHVFKQNSIHELTFTILNPQGIAPPGDQAVANVVQGYGCIAPKTLVNTGSFYIFLAKDGVRAWDGGNRSRLDVAQEARVISVKIDPIIAKIIKAGTFTNAVGHYYPKKEWYVLSYEDPDKFPRGTNNSSIVYDIRTDAWFPFTNWHMASIESFNGENDKGEMIYGDSHDGYVYYADLANYPNDARREFPIDTMDSSGSWLRGVSDYQNVKEGTGSLKLTCSATVTISSTSRLGITNIGEWPDKTTVKKSDRLSFKVFSSSIQNISSIRLDLEMEDNLVDFDTNFTSVTFSSAALSGGNNGWTTLEVSLSSFNIPTPWTSLSQEQLVFANTLTVYGFRFVLNGISTSAVSIDDFRVVGGGQTPLNAYRYTKQFNLGNPADKHWRQLILTREAAANTNFKIDVLNNFGQISGSYDVNGTFGKELFVGDYGGMGPNTESYGLARLSSVDFSIMDSTNIANRAQATIRPVVVDDQYIFAGDQYNNRIFRVDKSTSLTNLSGFTSFGTMGSGTTNFYIIYQLAVDDKYLYVTDFGNHRIKVHDKQTFDYVNAFGSLGTGTTNFHCPTGVAVDEQSLFVGDDGNYRIMKLDKLTGNFKSSVTLNMNTIGDTTLAVDDKYLYAEYNTGTSANGVQFIDVALEKRLKTDLSLVSRSILRPLTNQTYISTYSRLGDLSIDDTYIYVTFLDDINLNGSSYIQKLLKSDLSIVSENKLSHLTFTAAANGLAYKPKLKSAFQNLNTESAYIQLKYYETDQLDNTLKLYNQAFLYEQEPIQEKR